MSTSDLNAYWDSAVVNREHICPCAIHGGGPEKYQPVFYINGEAINLDVTFDTSAACDQFIADELEPPVPGWLEENPQIDATDEDLLDRIRTLVDRPTPKLDETLEPVIGLFEPEHKMPETTDEQLAALTTLVKLYMDKTDTHLAWHDRQSLRAQGYVRDHIHYDTDMGTGGVVR